MKKVCVIGGGAAGIMAAYSAAAGNASVRLLERNNKLGRKLLITGKGRCNLTNIGDLDDFMDNIPRNGAFLYSAFSALDNYGVISLLNEYGLETKVERGGRVFPQSDKSSDVLEALLSLLKRGNVEISRGVRVKGIEGSASSFIVTPEKGEKIYADSLIIATGGLSYPQTGSSGDGYRLAESFGHSVTELCPSLSALKVKENVSSLAGLGLKNVGITLTDKDGKAVYADFGEMLFTHNGVSGPVILSASAVIARRLPREIFTLIICFKPALDEKTLDLRLLRDFNKYKNKDIINSLGDLLPKNAIPVIIERSGISPHKKVNEVTKEERGRLADTLRAFTLTVTGAEGFENAVVTCGGVNVNEISPKTMESKIVKGLYFAGEIIDADALTGGYNLQIAFSTGFLAGRSAAL